MTRAALMRRFRRIEGQMRGLQKMVDNDRSCPEILTQIASAREALRQAAVALLRDHLVLRTQAALAAADDEAAVSELVRTFSHWVK